MADVVVEEVPEPSELKGVALAEALDAAGLPKTGTADEKRASLVEVEPDSAVAPVVGQPAVVPEDTEEATALAGVKTIDSHEASVGWTCQQADVPSEPDPVPGTVVTYAELPYRASLEAAGVDLEQYHASLDPAVVADDAERDAVRGVGTVPEGVPE